MRRDTEEAVERMDAITRYVRQLRRWLADPPAGLAEEDYDVLHEALDTAEESLRTAYKQWHAQPNERSGGWALVVPDDPPAQPNEKDKL